MDKTTASIEAGIRSGCELMKRIIERTKTAMRHDENRLHVMRDRLEALQSQPNPDETEIQSLKLAIEHLERQIENDRAALQDLENVYSENCSH